MIRVAVGVLRNAAGEVLLARRGPGTHLAGCWEFPGGKREEGEERWTALSRELFEELGVRARAGHPLIRVVHRYPERAVELDVWEVTAWEGDPYPREGQPLAWVAVRDLADRELPPADRPIVRAIGLPALYLVTPEPDLAAPDPFVEVLDRCFTAGIRLVQLRSKARLSSARERAQFDALVRGCAAVAAAHQGRIVVNASPGVDRGLLDAAAQVLHGVHLTSASLRTLDARPPGALVGASCHDAEELALAERLGVDFAVLGPVCPTASHPGAAALGWDGFERLVAGANLPVFGIGGLGPADLASARRHGAQGVAAIRALWRSGTERAAGMPGGAPPVAGRR